MKRVRRAIGRETTTERLGLPELVTVPYVDLRRYMGHWFEIARYPHRFEKGAVAATATYTLRPDGQIDVVNAAHQGSRDGPVKETRGRARVADPQTNAKLEVRFIPFVWQPYWIIDLAPDMSYSVVGHPSRDYLWVLSRTPRIDPTTYQGILDRISAQGYPLEPLELTAQPLATDTLH